MLKCLLLLLGLVTVCSCGGLERPSLLAEQGRIDAIELAIRTSPEDAQTQLLAQIEQAELSVDDFIHLTMKFVEVDREDYALEAVEAAQGQGTYEPELIKRMSRRIKYGSLPDHEIDLLEALREVMCPGCVAEDI